MPVCTQCHTANSEQCTAPRPRQRLSISISSQQVAGSRRRRTVCWLTAVWTEVSGDSGQPGRRTQRPASQGAPIQCAYTYTQRERYRQRVHTKIKQPHVLPLLKHHKLQGRTLVRVCTSPGLLLIPSTLLASCPSASAYLLLLLPCTAPDVVAVQNARTARERQPTNPSTPPPPGHPRPTGRPALSKRTQATPQMREAALSQGGSSPGGSWCLR